MTTKHPSILVLERFLPYRLSILSNRISGILSNTYKNKFALSVNEWRIMAMLGEHPNASADEVSTKIQIEKSIVSRALKNLLLRRLVNRVVETQDRRRHNLSLSSTGLDIYNQMVPVSYQYEEKLLTCFTQQEQMMFDTLSDKLYRHAEKLDLESEMPKA
ncbi:MAG: MarR family winged helix-turn-helix transcriptional regulator [Gammaproteobacteria bacterium]|nr:MarR family winged helix-turn-helix transcriptional regulator [Gammaproteobacteria bacterium]